MCVVYLCFDFGEFYIFPGLLEGGRRVEVEGGRRVEVKVENSKS